MKAGFRCVVPSLALGLLAAVRPVRAGEDEAAGRRAVNQREVAARLEHWQTQAATRPELWRRPGVLADRRAHTVRFLAEATGLGAGQIVEFFLISEQSGHDYEALAVSLARPGDLFEALEWIGLPAGRAVDPDAFFFWPKGERVLASVAPVDGSRPPQRLEDLVVDTQGDMPLPRSGLVFVGGPVHRPDGDGADRRVFGIDVMSPGSVASTYNEAFTLLDVPRAAPQNVVYTRFVSAPEAVFTAGELLEVTLVPEARETPRVLDVLLRAGPAPTPGADGSASLAGVRFSLRGGAVEADGLLVDALLRQLDAWVSANRDPYVTLATDAGLRLDQARNVARILASVEGDRGIRVEGPPPGTLYYKAYLPEERNRDRDARLMQPWELHLRRAASNAVAAVAVEIEQHWPDDAMRPELTVTEHPLLGPGDLQRLVQAGGSDLPVLLVFADGGLLVGDMMPFVAPLLGSHPTVHVFINAPSP